MQHNILHIYYWLQIVLKVQYIISSCQILPLISATKSKIKDLPLFEVCSYCWRTAARSATHFLRPMVNLTCLVQEAGVKYVLGVWELKLAMNDSVGSFRNTKGNSWTTLHNINFKTNVLSTAKTNYVSRIKRINKGYQLKILRLLRCNIYRILSLNSSLTWNYRHINKNINVSAAESHLQVRPRDITKWAWESSW